jgi:hypothetical protein
MIYDTSALVNSIGWEFGDSHGAQCPCNQSEQSAFPFLLLFSFGTVKLSFGEFLNWFPYIRAWQKPQKSSFITYMLICTTYLCVNEQYRFF